MIIRKIDGEHDWTFGKGLANYATAEAAIAENIQTRVLSWVNDCFFALEDGVDWYNRIDTGQQENLLQEVRTVILQSFGVVGINDLSGVFNPTTRTYVIQYDIETIYSPSFQSTLESAGAGAV